MEPNKEPQMKNQRGAGKKIKENRNKKISNTESKVNGIITRVNTIN